MIKFIVLYALVASCFLYLVPHVHTDTNYPYHKLLIFVIVFIGNMIINSLLNFTSIHNEKSSSISSQESALYALLAVVGYSLFIDVSIMEKTSPIITDYIGNDHQWSHLILCCAFTIIPLSILQAIMNLHQDEQIRTSL
uniref:Uncharacterized protein n=1 Tax=Megaviridae environmental sample TaxID=1737588 RepID=A0A5J6VI24_9VIRU|nr:MAG: hypothetical protein [Megaviridae environmental sample]